jgi:hypothetical protein
MNFVRWQILRIAFIPGKKMAKKLFIQLIIWMVLLDANLFHVSRCFDNMQYTASVSWAVVTWNHTQGLDSDNTAADRYSAWNPKQDHTFLWSLSP